jgi:hypothetical protein
MAGHFSALKSDTPSRIMLRKLQESKSRLYDETMELSELSFSNPFERSIKSHTKTQNSYQREEQLDDIKVGDKDRSRAKDRERHREERNAGFRCVSRDCRQWVPLNDVMGTKNRNHCPCCLASKHVDEKIGDRKSSCGARMDAIALTTKQEALNQQSKLATDTKYGELMLVHQCSSCRAYRINRLAADDHGHQVLEMFQRSLIITDSERALLKEEGITILDREDEKFIRSQFEFK